MNSAEGSARELIERHWTAANTRDWPAFAALLDPALRYEVPQTREYIEGAAGYLDMFQTWPQPWHAELKTLMAAGGSDGEAVTVVDFVTADAVMTGISIFRLREGRIVHVTDYWPEPYEPPPRQSAHIKRRPA